MMLALAVALAVSAPPSTAEVAAKVMCSGGTVVDNMLCLAVDHAGKDRFVEAAEAFEQAAQMSRQIAATVGDPRADRALAAAGNMWLAAGQPGRAALALDRALTQGTLLGDQRGEALLDRARAAEAQGDLKTARAKLTEAAASNGENPFLWYFSAALAIREGDRAAAEAAIGRALSLAPNDPAVLFEAGHVAHFTGDVAKARHYWNRAATADPDGPVGKAAKDAVALLGAEPSVQSPGGAPK